MIDKWLGSGCILKIGQRWDLDYVWSVCERKESGRCLSFHLRYSMNAISFSEDRLLFRKIGEAIQVEIRGKQLDRKLESKGR